VPELKEIETLRRSIEKNETSVAELKIAANFRGVNNIFPLSILIQLKRMDTHTKKKLKKNCFNESRILNPIELIHC
jgi:hypothetical protein